MSKKTIYRMVLTAMFLALALVLPFVTGQMKELGNALCPMHIPVLLCGFFAGPICGLICGAVAPILRFFLFGMPPLMPIGISMCFELATYGLVAGLLYKYFPKKKSYVYLSLLGAMILGRIIWGCARLVLYGLGKTEFGWQVFISGAILNAIPGIIIQIVIIPILVMLLEKFTIRRFE